MHSYTHTSDGCATQQRQKTLNPPNSLYGSNNNLENIWFSFLYVGSFKNYHEFISRTENQNRHTAAHNLHFSTLGTEKQNIC